MCSTGAVNILLVIQLQLQLRFQFLGEHENKIRGPRRE
jgi:hypothetical protein